MSLSDLFNQIPTDEHSKYKLLLMFLDQTDIDSAIVQEFIDRNKKTLANYIMDVETDWDFSIRFQGVVHSKSEFTIGFNSVEELDEVEILGPFGSPSESGKCWEFEQAVQQIKLNPNEYFSNLGGNRGVSWTPLKENHENNQCD